MPTYPEKLMYLRYVFVLFSLVTTACVVGFAAKSLKDLGDDRKLLHSFFPNALLDVSQMQSVTGAVVATSAFGVIVSLISEFFLAIERRHGLSTSKRIINEILLAFAALALLACCIAGTIISKGKAKVTVPGFNEDSINAMLKLKGKSVLYRDSWAWKAVIVGWAACGCLLITLVLVLATGVYYRKSARMRSHENSEGTYTPDEKPGFV